MGDGVASPLMADVEKAMTTPRSSVGSNGSMNGLVNSKRHRFPHCIVWTPIPLMTWICPFIGHMGIAMSSGIIRDFAGSYYVSEDDMAFGWPTRYYQLPLEKVVGGSQAWDKSVLEASEEYHHRTHNLCCDNCHSHVALALNSMSYDGSTSWNMFKLACLVGFRGKHNGILGVIKTWLPFFLFIAFIVVLINIPLFH